MVEAFPSVFHAVGLEGESSFGRICTLCALVRFFWIVSYHMAA